MPGIHIHKLSQLDWIGQEKKPFLTIPGSYWLCHKKNIYKFIFKYHRLTKNITQFSYGKELLKIIRRIIKCHPSQGQQFGTQHLLVTYNYTSWTRQDKMFALLKFQQRTNAAAFSHAFVLTVKICSSSEEESPYNLKYLIVREIDTGTTFKDSKDTADIDEKATKTVIHTTDKVSTRKVRMYPNKRISQILKHSENTSSETSKAPINSTLQNDTEKSINLREELDERGKKTTCTVMEEDLADICDIKLHDSMYVNKSTTYASRKYKKDAEQDPVAYRQDQLETVKKDEIEKANGASVETKRAEIQMQHQKASKIRKCQIFSSSKPSSTGIIKDDYNANDRLLDKSSFDGDSMRQERTADDKTNSIHSDGIGENVDSSKIPDQYFIKKDLDSAEQDRPSARSATFSPVIDKSAQENSQQDTSEENDAENFVLKIEDEKVDEEYIRKEQRNEAVDDRAQSNTYSKSCSRARRQRNKEFSEKKSTIDDKVLRSSNITDLVMEGLMFTIRQDQDSVAVIEQKTKLEVDEVLENSEKVETEAGEKCLLNSSLLRLENLITMIDPPHEKDEQHRTANHSVIGNSAYSSPLNVSNTASHLDNINYVDRTTNKLGIPNYERHSLMDQSSLHGFSWQQRPTYSTIANNNSYSANTNAMEMNQSMDWEASDHERDEKCMNDTEIINEKGKEEIEEVEDEEEDIIPEVFRSTVFSPEKTDADPLNTELLMDDMDVEEIDKLDMSMKSHDNSLPVSCHSSSSNKMPTSQILTFSEKSKSAKRDSNVPRVISNKAITVEQIPLALQKILRHTRRLKTANEISAAHDDKEKTQNTRSTENAAPETNAPSDQSKLSEFRWQQEQAHSDIAHDSHSTNRNLTEKKSEQSVERKDDNHERGEECTNNASSVRNRDVDSETVDKSVIEITDNAEETRNEDKDKSHVVINLEDAAESSSGNARHTRKKNETHHVSRTTSSIETRTKHGPPRKLQNITEDFYHDLVVHNQDISVTQQRYLRQRRKSLNSPEDIKNGKVRIEMLKFIQDMVRGVKVVVRRLNLDNRPNLS